MAPDPTTSTDRVRGAGPGWFLDWCGDVQLVHMDGGVTDRSYERYLEILSADFQARTPEDRFTVFYSIPEPAAMSSRRRHELAAILKEHREIVGATTLAYAMATPSAVVRGGLKMLFWLAPPPYPNRVVSTAREAFAYLASRDSRVIASEVDERWCALLAAYRRKGSV